MQPIIQNDESIPLFPYGSEEVGVMRGRDGGQGDALKVVGQGLKVLLEDEWVPVEIVPSSVADDVVDAPVRGDGRRDSEN